MKKIKIGLSYITGRAIFHRSLELIIKYFKKNNRKFDIEFSLFVFYDTKLNNLHPKTFKNIKNEIKNQFESIYFYNNENLIKEIRFVTGRDSEMERIGSDYAGKRNFIMYQAIKNKIDYLIYIDDDEYPFQIFNSKNSIFWKSQDIINARVDFLPASDITVGKRCGYLSPIPQVELNNLLTFDVWKDFLLSINSDILTKNDIKEMFKNNGITYCDDFENREIFLDKNRCKFITGGNLGINLTRLKKVNPFYNPYKARGEDSFLSTSLADSKVMSVVAYTFHDCFCLYDIDENNLPQKLVPAPVNDLTVKRFYNACVGWIRYKPLFTYITNKTEYEIIIESTKKSLSDTLPTICQYFNAPQFNDLLYELNVYDKNVVEQFEQFERLKVNWKKLIGSI